MVDGSRVLAKAAPSLLLLSQVFKGLCALLKLLLLEIAAEVPRRWSILRSTPLLLALKYRQCICCCPCWTCALLQSYGPRPHCVVALPPPTSRPLGLLIPVFLIHFRQRGSLFSVLTDVISETRSHVHRPNTLRVTSTRSAYEEPTHVHASRAAECPLQSSTEVHEENLEEIHGNNSSHIEASTEASTGSTSKVRKTRGPTSKSITKPPTGQKWKCIFIDQQPVGVEASKLAEVLGLYARNDSYFPPYKEWKEQSKQSLNDVMKEILVEYDFVDKEGLPANMACVTRFCEGSISSKVKEWRANLKRAGYMEGINEELSVTPPDERVTQATWDLLLRYWRNPKKIQETERNKNNRAEDQATHTLGAKSIARHNHEQREKLGDSYSTLGAYLTAHQTKNGEYPNEYTQTICEKVIETCEERNVTNSFGPSILSPILDVVYNGHHGGYERGRGLGWSRGAQRHNMTNEASNDNIRRLTTELESTQTELQNAMATIDGMRAREREMEARQREHMETMHTRERELAEAMQAREREMQVRLDHMEVMMSTCLPNSLVGDSRSRVAISNPQPSRQ